MHPLIHREVENVFILHLGKSVDNGSEKKVTQTQKLQVIEEHN